MIARKHKDKVTVIDEGRFLALQASEAELAARGISLADAEFVTDHEWRAAFVSAAAATAKAVADAMPYVAEASDLAALQEQQASLATSINDLQQQIADDHRRSEIRDLEIRLGKDAERMVEVATTHGVNDGPDLQRAIWSRLWETPAGRRLEELRED